MNVTPQVLVVGNPANTNCLICQRNAPSIPKENFSCMTRLDQNRAQAQVGLGHQNTQWQGLFSRGRLNYISQSAAAERL